MNSESFFCGCVLSGGHKSLKGIPSPDTLSGAGRQTHIAFAHALACPQFSGIEGPREFQDEKAPSATVLS
jgi:hypothetical protein